ncbi:hypothetical protein BV898_13207 [Hypsibius exemplaris]|uniref:Ionotropic glutamate receptor C-terminal domain-containing protein n=1 Tax=Hypsibius exemplaris TaxID=2072580 RepID=A0A1W0WBM7_HYPEX|nr:hypothetical protein BV898_13207 [Hypsibius exemplaris]
MPSQLLMVCSGVALCSLIISSSHAQTYASTGSTPCPGAGTLPSVLRVSIIPEDQTGFFLELLDALQTHTGIPYKVTNRTDLTNFGQQNADGSWTGSLLGELLADRADLVASEFTITSLRQSVLDFLLPLGSYQLEILANAQFGVNTSGLQYLSFDNADLTYLKNSKNPDYRAIAANIEAGRPASILSNDQAGQNAGIAKVLGGNFAFILSDRDVAGAVAANPGKLVRVPSPLGTFSWSVPIQQGSPFRVKLNVALLQLAEEGLLSALIAKHPEL